MTIRLQHLPKKEVSLFESVGFSPCGGCGTPSLCVIMKYALRTEASRMISATFFWSAFLHLQESGRHNADGRVPTAPKWNVLWGISYTMLVITLRAVLAFVGVPKLPPPDREELSNVINILLSPRITTAVSSVHSIVVLSVSHFKLLSVDARALLFTLFQ